MKCIILICGPPACLKSTLVRILQLILNDQQTFNLEYLCFKKIYEIFYQKTQHHKRQHNFLSFDNLLCDFEHDIIENELNWKSYRLLIANEIENYLLSNKESKSFVNLKYSSIILDRLHETLQNLHKNSVLVIDDNFYYSSMRHRFRQIAQRAQCGFTSIHLISDLHVALQRNQNRELSKRVSNASIENIYAKYDTSNEDIIIDTTHRGLTCDHLNRILERIQQACNQPEQVWSATTTDEQRRLATEINQQNLIYQTDQKLRKFVSRHLKEEFINNEKLQTAISKKVYAEMVNNKRQTFLELIKHKLILLDDKESDVENLFQQFLEENSCAMISK